MKITALLTARLVNEIRASLDHAHIVNLHKSEKAKTVVIHFDKEDGQYSLVLHFGGNISYLYLRGGHRPRIVTTNFLPQLRGHEVVGVSQGGFDRIIEIGLKGKEGTFKLIFELFGLNSNLYLTDDDFSIITSIRKSKLNLEKYQPSEPLPYENPLEFDTYDVVEKLMVHAENSLIEAAMKIFSGLNEEMLRPLAEVRDTDLEANVSDFSAGEIRGFIEDLRNVCRDFVNPETEFSYDPESQEVYLTDVHGLPHTSKLSDILFEFSRSKSIAQKEKSKKQQALDVLRRAIKKENKKIEKLKRQFEQAEEYPKLQRQAELLSANLHKVKKGMSEVKVEDIYSPDGGIVKIELDKSLTPSKNMERLFTQAKKYKDKIPGIENELGLTRKNLNCLEKLQSELENIEGESLPSELTGKLQQAGILTQIKGEKKSKAETEHLPYREFKTTRGETVLVGKSARDNDQLTFKVARKNDLWFHSQQTSGSHVILRRPNRAHEFQKASIIEASEIAAFYSPAKNSETVPVIYTEVKYVRKARKGAPGLVIAERTKSILVTPRRPKN